MRSVDLREFQYFVALAGERHFGRAAERLYLDRSGLSKAMGRLESALGVQLFSRGSGRVVLTAAGTALLQRSEEVMQAFGRIRTMADALQSGASGRLAIGSCPEVRYQLMAPILMRFASTSPEVRILRREQRDAEIVEDVLAGALDVGVATHVPVTAGLSKEPLKDIELRVLLAGSHPLANRERVTLRELAGERFLISSREASAGAAARARALLDAAQIEAAFVNDAIDCDEDFQAVRRGEGAMLSARTFFGGPPLGVCVLRLDPPPTVTAEMVWASVEQPSAALARFLEIARDTSLSARDTSLSARDTSLSSPAAA